MTEQIQSQSGSQNGEVLLTMTNVSKSFPGVKALDHANLSVRSHSVHALMGENGAGKSTLLKCLFGIYAKDEGEILFLGKPVNFKTSKEALENGISMVHQELNLVRQTSVMDNLWLGRYPLKGPFVDHAKMYRDTKAIFDELDIDVDPREKVAKLSVSQMQMIEIAKAFSYNAKIVIMDEPTSSLSEKEVEHLFKIIQKLKDRGCGIIYISHKMDEIFKICDEITILRDGKWINTIPVKGTTMDQIVSMMVGRELTQRFPEKTNVPKEITLEVENLTALNQPSIQDVSFNLRKGEILGIAGLVGAKRTDIVEAIFGVRELKSGTIKLNGKTVKNHTALEAINNGFALVTEERRSTGIYSNLSIEFNSLISNMKSYLTPWKLLSNKKMNSDTQWVIDSMNVKTPSHKTTIGSLSGGNQQKVIIGRWLLTQPEILMLDEPTRGIDIGAKFEIYQLIQELAKKDKGIIMISSEMPELLGVTDRILVMSNGKVAGIVETAKTSQEEILQLAAKYLGSVKDSGNDVVVVVSAMGKTTDALIKLAHEITDKPDLREMDRLMSTGEQQTIALLSIALQTLGYEAISLTGAQAGIKTSGHYTKNRIEDINGKEIKEHLSKGKIVVVAGFQGVNEAGDVTTLGRGGSDTSAVALAAALGGRCEIYTDVDGIYTIDPRVYKKAKKLSVISYDEMMELAFLGAGVMEPRAVELGSKYGVEIYVGKSLGEKNGTIITSREKTKENKEMEQKVITGVSINENMEVRYDVYLEDENEDNISDEVDFDAPMKRLELIFSHITEEEKEILEKYNFKYEYTEDNKIKLKEENAIY
ncbi:MAG: galactose/methyl galactoside ABC transporter ATP-binding protein MglA, partial [Aggregatibacter sp.]